MAGGRPTKYKAEYAAQAAKLCKLGATDAELADFFAVSTSTIYLWKVEYKEFSESLKLPKRLANDRVARSLYQRAIGYTHDDVDIRTVALGDNQGSEVVQTQIKKHYPPDTAAAFIWLKNRDSANWRERVEHTGANGGPVAMLLTEASALKDSIRGKV